MHVTKRTAFIVSALLPTIIEWGFTEGDLTHAITMARLPGSFVIYNPRKVQIVADARHRQRMRDRGETLTRAAALDTRTSLGSADMPKSSHVFVFVTTIDGTPVLRADWQAFPENSSGSAQRSRKRKMYTPKMPDIDPGHQGHTVVTAAQRLQRLVNRG